MKIKRLQILAQDEQAAWDLIKEHLRLDNKGMTDLVRGIGDKGIDSYIETLECLALRYGIEL